MVPEGEGFEHSFIGLEIGAGMTLAEAAVLARHANAMVTGADLRWRQRRGEDEDAARLVQAGLGS